MALPRIADMHAGEWQEHPRFAGIYMKGLLTSADNPYASANVVRVPPGGVIGRHTHPQQVETVWIIRGDAVLTLNQTDMPMPAGQIVAIPMNLEHALRNDGETMVELLTFFTPPMR